MSKVRTLRVSAPLLAQALNLPKDTAVLDVRFVQSCDWFELRVEHNDFDDAPNAPVIGVTFHCEYHYCPSDGSTWQKLTARWQ